MPKRANPVIELQYAYLGLHQAALSGNVGLVQYALSQGQPVDAVWDGISALHAAAAGGSEHVVKLLLDNGADVNFGRQAMTERELRTRTATTSSPSTPSAATDVLPSHDTLVHLLNPGSTPLHFACAHNHAAVARLLLASGAAPHLPDKKGVTSLDLLPPSAPPLPASSSPSLSSLSPPPDTIRTVIREYYEKEKAKEKEFQKNSQSHLQFHGKAAAVLGFPKVEEETSGGSSSGTTTATSTMTTTTSKRVAAKRSLEGLLALTGSSGNKIRGKSPPPSPARYTFTTTSSSTTPPPLPPPLPPLSHRRPSLPHVASSASSISATLSTRSPSPYRTRTPSTTTSSSARPRSADADDAPLFGATAHTPRSATLPSQSSHSHTLSASLFPTYHHASSTLPQPRPPRNKRSLLSLFSKKDNEDKRERDKIRQASFGASAPSVMIPVTAPPGRTTFAVAASTEVFVDDEDEDYGKLVKHGSFSHESTNNAEITEYGGGGASSGSEGDEESGSGSEDEGGEKGLELDLGIPPTVVKTPPMGTTLTLPTISTSPPPVPKIPSPHVSPLVTRRTPPGILRSTSGSTTTSPSSTRPNSNILRRSGSLRFQEEDTDERPSTRERELQRKPSSFGSGRKSMDGYEGRSLGPLTRSPTMRKKSSLSLRERTSTPTLRDRDRDRSGRSGSGSTSPATTRRKSSGVPVPPLPPLDYLDPPSTPSTEEDGLDGNQQKGLDIHSVSSMAEARALVNKAAQEILDLGGSELDGDEKDRSGAGGGGGGGGGLSLSEQLAAYGEKLAIERRFARGEKQRWKSEKEKEEEEAEVAAMKEEDGRERDREEERRKRVQERMLWSQRTIERYARREGERDKEREGGVGIGISKMGCPLERTTSLEKEVKTAPSPPRSSRKIRRPHTSDSVNSSASSTIPRFGHSSAHSSGNIRVQDPNGEQFQVFQREAMSFDYGPRDREKDKDKYRGRRSEDILRTAFDAKFDRDKDRELLTHVSAPPILPIAPPVVFTTSSGASSSSNVADEGGGRPLKRFGGGLRSLFSKGRMQ